jgi:hypothetical protein
VAARRCTEVPDPNLIYIDNNATFTGKLLRDFVTDSCEIMGLEERSAAVAHKLSAAAM